MDWAMFPPEVNSAKMYAGPGSGSLLAAASSWDGLAAELQSTAETYGSVVSGLISFQWMGPASASMAAAATPYVQWLTTTAAQAKQTAAQAMAAVAAFEEAFAMTVPPPVIAANRAQLQTLIATNFFGQNTPAIAATEAHYAEMWAQDAAAMYGYATSSSTAAKLTPFTPPQQSTNLAGVTAQNNAVAQAAASPAGAAQTQVSALQQAPAPIVPEDFTVLDGILAVFSTASVTQNMTAMNTRLIGAADDLGVLPDLGAVSETVPALGGGLAPLNTLANGVSGGGLSAGGLGGGVSAAFRSAGSIGQLSVPSAWAAPAVTNVTALSHTPLTTLPTGEVAEAGAPGMPGYPGMPFAGSGRGGGIVPRYGARLTVMARPLSGG